MPTAPRFHVAQDAAFVYMHIHVPYVRVSEMEFHVDGLHFSFYCKPYLLKLQFPHEVVDDELAKAVYDPNKENGTIVVHLPKKEPGLEFPDLDLLTKLLQPKKVPQIDLKTQSKPAPLIEVIQSTEVPSVADDNVNSAVLQPEAASDADATLLELEKRFAEVKAAEAASYDVRVSDLKPRYGFNNAYSEVFRGWHGDTSEILSLPNPEETPAADRRRLREMGEDTHFDIERYLLDFANAAEDEYLEMALNFTPQWRNYPVVKASAKLPELSEPNSTIVEVGAPVAAASLDAMAHEIGSLSLTSQPAATPTLFSAGGDASAVLSDSDRELLARLPNKEYLMGHDSSEEQLAFGGLLDILIGYVYEQLTTQGDSGIESTWTISILSPTLAWLDMASDVPSIVRSGVRRMITFPLLRQYHFAIHVAREVAELLRRGKRVVLHSLLDIFRIVEKSETQYLLNSIFIQDYCIWIQSVSDERLVRLADDVSTCLDSFAKSTTGWALDELERQLLERSDDDEAGGGEATSGESDEDDSSEDASESSASEDNEGHDEVAVIML